MLCPNCDAQMRRVYENTVLHQTRWHCPRCLHEEFQDLSWHLALWKRKPGGTGHEVLKRLSFGSRKQAERYLVRNVQVGHVTWFDGERRCSVVLGK